MQDMFWLNWYNIGNSRDASRAHETTNRSLQYAKNTKNEFVVWMESLKKLYNITKLSDYNKVCFK